ncbi:GNAT family N-acetyltransferase [Actinocorallia sp. A-T 12471]|uniref:GNAT family N-acetyltransferase n=1 Tax=Actinocorallia sp. A-T 12471 TaxID=3089813 RepID=UPI0029D0EBB3|nr:GNAT family N-acetyltransferase [Actinocorallia sp. A-T 12471]MDX6743009.1 GNAT family N-acetyltransferase [Actinocorallia sp. A-T 12471]
MKSVETEITTWYLEQTSPDDLVPARPAAVEVIRAEVPSPEFSRYLYFGVGGDYQWSDRLPWGYDEWAQWLERPGSETWVAWDRGTPAGYAEFNPGDDGSVEIICFGLLPAFTGKGFGGHLLTEAVRRAWTLDERHDLPKTSRVWLHTCSLDGPAALPNYRARGFRVYDTRFAIERVWARPLGPWPGSPR